MKNQLKYLTTATTILFLTSHTLQNTQCLVDQCKFCSSPTEIVCSECEKGYYVRTFYGKEKGKDYNACWSIFKLLWGLLGVTLLLLTCCLCSYLAYKQGQKLRNKRSEDKEKKFKNLKRYQSSPSETTTQVPESARRFISPQGKGVLKTIDAPNSDNFKQLTRNGSNASIKTLPPIRRYASDNKENIQNLSNMNSGYRDTQNSPKKTTVFKNIPNSPGSPTRRIIRAPATGANRGEPIRQPQFNNATNAISQYIPANQNAENSVTMNIVRQPLQQQVIRQSPSRQII
jgi:hypothetical protein